jgi:hypothetical protein
MVLVAFAIGFVLSLLTAIVWIIVTLTQFFRRP